MQATSILAHVTKINAKGYPVKFMVMHPTLFGKFIQNTWIRDLVFSGIANLGATGGNFTLPGYPTVQIATDFALTETPDGTHGPIIGNSRGLIIGQGPTMAESTKMQNEDATAI